MFEGAQAKVGSVVAAAMETMGTQYQERMLELVNGPGGQTLAGLLFLIAIIGAIVIFAAGGSYAWGKYLLIGPPLFFFLTQVTVPSAGTNWVFGEMQFSRSHKEQALKGVSQVEAGPVQGAGSEVAFFFEFWNVFMSDVTHELIRLLNLTADDSHLNFINKIERYMEFWNNSFIDDQFIKGFIKLALVHECADYYMLLKLQSDPAVSDAVKSYYQPILEEKKQIKVHDLDSASRHGGKEMEKWMTENGFDAGATYTCQELWEGTVEALRPVIQSSIEEALNTLNAPDQDPQKTKATFYKKLFTETSIAHGMTKLELVNAQEPDANGLANDELLAQGLLRAVDWVIARSLFHEIWDQNSYYAYLNLEQTTGVRNTGAGSLTNEADTLSNTHNAMQQLNQVEQYKFKADYVNFALALPHLQGVMLMLLAAAYPFFAIMVVIPGRAGAILTWMGLWAWLKLWDLGFAVVMMIDNILYALFPRGPNLEPGDIDDAGKAWTRIMEVDPNYSSAIYYNLVATCLFSVPLVTAVFVRGGANELVNLVHGTLNSYANRLGNSAAAFAGSLQAQSYAGRLARGKYNYVREQTEKKTNSEEMQGIRSKVKNIGKAIGALDEKKSQKELSGYLAKTGMDPKWLMDQGASAMKSVLKEEQSRLQRIHSSQIKLAGAQAAWDYTSSTVGTWAASSAVAARYSSHALTDSYPLKERINAWANKRMYNKGAMLSSIGDKGLKGAPKKVLGPGGKSN